MKLINRTVVIVKPRQPYVDWANGLQNGSPRITLEDARETASAILIREQPSVAASRAYVDEHCQRFFENELSLWMQDPGTWPEDRSLQAFRRWFDVEIHEPVYDFAHARIQIDEL